MYGIAIIGCGDMGSKHAAAWDARDDARTVAVCDRNDGRADKLAQTYRAAAFYTWQEAMAQDGVDIVSVCVPACDHRDIAVAAAELGRHVLCEKPMALSLEEADDMIAAAKTSGVRLSVSHQYRGLSRFKTVKQLIDEGRLGSPLYIRFAEMREVRPKLAMHRRSKNGGPVHDMTGHLFDLARFFTGAEAQSVVASGTIFGKGKERLATVADFGIDTAEIQMRFDGGHCLSIGLNWGLPEGTPGHCHEVIHGPLGLAYSVDPKASNRFLGDISDTVGVFVSDANGTEWIKCENDNDGPQVCITELLDAVETGKTSQFDGREGREALRLILASLESVESDQQVMLSG